MIQVNGDTLQKICNIITKYGSKMDKEDLETIKEIKTEIDVNNNLLFDNHYSDKSCVNTPCSQCDNFNCPLAVEIKQVKKNNVEEEY